MAEPTRSDPTSSRAAGYDELLELVQMYSDDAHALGAMIERYTPIMHRVASVVLSEPAQADQAVCDAWRAIRTRQSTWHPRDGSIAVWLVRAARDAAVERRKRQPRRTEAETLVGPSLRQATPSRAPAPPDFDTVRAREQLSKLPPLERQALEAAFFTGLAYGEIAELLEAPVQTVKGWIRHGLETLAAATSRESV